jgi:hypothetical protein
LLFFAKLFIGHGGEMMKLMNDNKEALKQWNEAIL